eukprot:164354-Pleurochrysis_carterae.AAC.1
MPRAVMLAVVARLESGPLGDWSAEFTTSFLLVFVFALVTASRLDELSGDSSYRRSNFEILIDGEIVPPTTANFAAMRDGCFLRVTPAPSKCD